MSEFTSSFSLEVSNESRYNSEISSTVVHVNTLISSPPSIRRWRVLHLVPIVFLSVLVLPENWRGDLPHLGFSFLTLSAKPADFTSCRDSNSDEQLIYCKFPLQKSTE